MTTPVCSERVLASEGWRRHPCSKPVRVERDGKPYCTVHDPERRKRQDASKCWHRIYGRLCGAEAVEVDDVGYGLCAAHTEAARTTRALLGTHGPALLEALQRIGDLTDAEVQMAGLPALRKIARDALAKLNEKGGAT